MKHLAKLKTGTSFGELGFLSGHTRVASIITDIKSTFIVLSRADYDGVIRDMNEEEFEEIYLYLSALSIMREVPREVVRGIVGRCVVERYGKGGLLWSRGWTRGECVWLGKGVRILRRVYFRDRDDNLGEYCSEKNPTVQLDELNPGSCFCHHDAFQNRPMTYTAVASIPSEIYFIFRSKNIGIYNC